VLKKVGKDKVNKSLQHVFDCDKSELIWRGKHSFW